jgi:hypothetical protein
MKSIYYLAIAATAVVTAACSAKRTISRSGLPQMVPDTVLLVNNNGMVDLNMSIIIPPKSIKRHALMELTPVIVGENQILELPSIEINSSKYSDAPYSIPRKLVKHGATINYKERFPYAEWMANSNTYLRGLSIKSSGRDVVMDRQIARGVYTPHKAAQKVCPTAKEQCDKMPVQRVVSVSKSGCAHFNYTINSAKINPNLDENAQNLKAIENLLTSVLSDTSKHIVSIIVIAESSPDGTYSKNLALAQQRAAELSSYIKSHCDCQVPSDAVKSDGRVAQWKEAIPLVEQLSIPASQKNKIIEIIRNCTDQAHCEKMLRAHADLYNILKRDVLPQLRDATYTVNYVQNIY